MKQHQQIFQDLSFTIRPFDTQLSEILRNHGIQRSEWSVLYTIVHEPDITAAEIAKRLTFEKPNMTRIIKDLTNAGYIDVETSAEDKRRKHLRITPLGKEKYLEARVTIDAFEMEILEGVTEEERIHLLRILEKMRTNLNRRVRL
ncbi:MarR family winged helix-turn-helix transcriptional regulator [Neobacillus thermocopriae]|uniref:MarR family transcriptional regulator n=1 Tax=Neobacillus thermocopriae TaxID=1215031 RepID=A0A6B3TTQ8_9BACI|nr:MarR family transcriptional regulator [Neobacillus thermocopriae]MED3623555.1 MarR family transcriptional regulator [Neobacillus thermocopriae]MED3714455.1 MarR family transcriptional regulator [Neobacillus thermocopriae]NEX79828.1 MarR family transcriptional regulator [Neobacillus thermocopriae]